MQAKTRNHKILFQEYFHVRVFFAPLFLRPGSWFVMKYISEFSGHIFHAFSLQLLAAAQLRRN
jgi:hypothetical protein